MEIENNGVGVPDNSAAAGTQLESDPVVDNISDDGLDTAGTDTVEGDQQTTNESEDDYSQYVVETPQDTDLVKKLRGLVKTKFDDYKSRIESQQQPSLTQEQLDAIEMVNGLYGFDTESGKPTAKTFVDKLVQRDFGLAEQTLYDLVNTPVPNAEYQGYTLAHRLLEQMGLDPFKIEDLRALSRGEHTSFTPTTDVPDLIPKEYTEAYKEFNEVARSDIEIYLNSDDPNQRAAALQMLQDRQTVINNRAADVQRQQQMEMQFNSEVVQEVDNQLSTTYQGLLDGIKKNPAYTEIKVSANDQIDSMVKNTLIAQLTALADPNSVFASQGLAAFENIGIKIDAKQVTDLMETIEKETAIAVKADKAGKLQNRDYSAHVQAALGRRNSAVQRVLALANKYFSEALGTMTNKQVTRPTPNSGIPNISGITPSQGQEQQKRSFSTLEALALETARTLQNNQ